MNLMV